MNRYLHVVRVVALTLLAGCGADTAPSNPPDRSEPGTVAPSTGAGAPTVQDSSLSDDVEAVVAFLRGAADYETLSLADTVRLILPPDAGGMRRSVPREELRERAAWIIESNGQRYSLIPTEALTVVRIAPGRHFNCVEVPLATVAPDLAGLPHAGVRLEPRAVESCLQGWNATFVFDTASPDRSLVAVVYDQWEW